MKKNNNFKITFASLKKKIARYRKTIADLDEKIEFLQAKQAENPTLDTETVIVLAKADRLNTAISLSEAEDALKTRLEQGKAMRAGSYGLGNF